MRPSQKFAYLGTQARRVWLVVLASAGVHAVLVFLLVWGGLRGNANANLREKAMITRLLKKGKERPKDWLPRKPAEAPAVAPPSAPAPTTSPSTKTPTAAQPRPSGVDYSKQMSKALSGLRKQDGSKPSKEEPEGSPDGIEEGDSLIAELGNAYLTKIYKLVHSNYVVPEIISERERLFLQATVVITLDAKGKIVDLSFEKRSDNQLFNSAIENAIRKTAPFPPPPKELAEKYRSEGIGMNFRASKM